MATLLFRWLGVDMIYSDRKGFGANAKGIFDCTCLRVLIKEGFRK